MNRSFFCVPAIAFLLLGSAQAAPHCVDEAPAFSAATVFAQSFSPILGHGTFAAEASATVPSVARVGGQCGSEADRRARQADNRYVATFGAGGFGVTGAGAREVTATVGGASLTDTNEKLALAREIVGPTPPSGWRAAAALCPGSGGVECALTGVLGSREAARRVLAFPKRSGYLASLDQTDNLKGKHPGEQLWSLEELRYLDDAIDELPPQFLKIPTFKYFYRRPGHNATEAPVSPEASVRASARAAGPGGGDPGAIELFGKAFAPGRVVEPTLLLIHEISHQYDYSGSATGREQADFWSARTGLGRMTRSDYVSVYASSHTREDFADTAAYYVRWPELLRARSPDKYDLFKKEVFRGREYVQPPEWPTLEQAIADEGGPRALATECVEAIASARIHQGFIYINERRDQDMVAIEDFLDAGACVARIAARLKEKLARDPRLCAVGEPGLRRAVALRMSAEVAQALIFAERLLKSGADPELEASGPARPLNGFRASETARILATFARVLPPSPAAAARAEQALARVPAADLVAGCLQGLSKIRLGKGYANFYTSGVDGYATSLAKARGCTDGFAPALRAQGVSGPLPDPFVASGVAVLAGLSEEIESWKARLAPVPEAQRAAEVPRLLAAWWQKQGLGEVPASVRASIERVVEIPWY